MKTKRNSIKKKVQSFSCESDDAAIEPLLQKDKDEQKEIAIRSAKFLLSKTKTDIACNKADDKSKLILEKPNVSLATENVAVTNNFRDKIPSITTIHNHMNTNVFHDISNGVPKSSILVKIDGSGCNNGYSSSPLIFTVAKIHTDNKTNQTEPAPISSTIEGGLVKTESVKDIEKSKAIIDIGDVKGKNKEEKGIKSNAPSSVKYLKNTTDVDHENQNIVSSLKINSECQCSTDAQSLGILNLSDSKLPKTIYGINDLEDSNHTIEPVQSVAADATLRYEKEPLSNKSNTQKISKTISNGDLKLSSSSDTLRNSAINAKIMKLSSDSKLISNQQGAVKKYPSDGKTKNGNKKLEKVLSPDISKSTKKPTYELNKEIPLVVRTELDLSVSENTGITKSTLPHVDCSNIPVCSSSDSKINKIPAEVETTTQTSETRTQPSNNSNVKTILYPTNLPQPSKKSTKAGVKTEVSATNSVVTEKPSTVKTMTKKVNSSSTVSKSANIKSVLPTNAPGTSVVKSTNAKPKLSKLKKRDSKDKT